MGEYKGNDDKKFIIVMLIISLCVNIGAIYKCARIEYKTRMIEKIVNNFFYEVEKNGIGIE